MKPHVFLTNPPLNMAETPLQYHRPLVPLGLGYIGAILEEHFSEGRYRDYLAQHIAGRRSGRYQPSGRVAAQDNMFLAFYYRYSRSELLSRIAAFFEDVEPDEQWIGLSVLSDGMKAARKLLQDFRHCFPNAKVIVGGPHATFFPYDFYLDRETKTTPLADYVVRNEGEHAILGIVEGELDTFYGVCKNGGKYGIDSARCDYSHDEYRVIDGGQYGSRSQDPYVLDTLPVPAYFLFEDGNGNLPYEPDYRYGLQAPAANINSSRGCPHKCTFCTIPSLVPGYRTLSPQRIVEIMGFLSTEYNVSSIFFREDNFLYSGGAAEGDRWPDINTLCSYISERNILMNWAIEARADNLMLGSGVPERSRLQIMHEAGLSGIYVGVESGSPTMLKLFGKGNTVSGISDALKAVEASGVKAVATSVYADSDIFRRSQFPLVSLGESNYEADSIAHRERILAETRRFMDMHNIPPERREEYALVGIPISAIYNVLDSARSAYPQLVEYYDLDSRYIYPKGFRWWATKIYELKRLVRPFVSFDFDPQL